MSDSLRKILIIDDEADMVETLRDRLEFEGFEVFSADDGVKGIALAQSESPDLIIMDVMMPRLDGFRATRKLKEDSQTKNIPIVMLTAKTQDIDMLRGSQAGADEYVVKPFDFNDLFSIIKSYFS